MKQVNKGKYKKIGIIATKMTIENRLYDLYFKKLGITLLVPNRNDQKTITKIILNILEGRKYQKDVTKIKEIINKMRNDGAEAVVLGCTDIPLLINQNDSLLPLFDSLQVLADASLNKAIKANRRSD
jgi:aspartate racemase